MQSQKNGGSAAIKAAILALFIGGAIFVVHYTPLGAYLSAERLRGSIDTTTYWAPVAFMLVYIVGVCLFVPATVLIALGVAVFGISGGFVYSWLASLVGSSLSFYIGRYLGRDFAARIIGQRLKKYDEAIETYGFSTVLYLRLACLPFAPLNFGMGLTKVRFRDFFWGTALGILVVTFAITLSVGAIRDIWAGGAWDASLAWKVLFVVCLFAFSLSVPRIIKVFRRDEQNCGDAS
jgi:uncharacterized membrane protein YdjX (TVP38/TMEM64 family)